MPGRGRLAWWREAPIEQYGRVEVMTHELRNIVLSSVINPIFYG